jgi:ankyrin repeat protein
MSSSSPLYSAVDQSDESRVRAALQSAQAASQLNMVDANSNKTPLYLACEDGAWRIVAQLLAAGARTDVKCTRAESVALHAAAYYSRADVVSQLLAAGASARRSQRQRHLAAPRRRRQRRICPLSAHCSVRRVLHFTACVDRHGASPLHYAAAQLEGDLVRALLAAEPRLATLRDAAGLEPAHYAAADAGSADADVSKLAMPLVLAALADAGSAAAKAGLPALKLTLRDAPDAARRHIAQVAHRAQPSERVRTTTLRHHHCA